MGKLLLDDCKTSTIRMFKIKPLTLKNHVVFFKVNEFLKIKVRFIADCPKIIIFILEADFPLQHYDLLLDHVILL